MEKTMTMTPMLNPYTWKVLSDAQSLVNQQVSDLAIWAPDKRDTRLAFLVQELKKAHAAIERISRAAGVPADTGARCY